MFDTMKRNIKFLKEKRKEGKIEDLGNELIYVSADSDEELNEITKAYDVETTRIESFMAGVNVGLYTMIGIMVAQGIKKKLKG